MINFFYRKAQAIISGSKNYRTIKGKVHFVQKKDGVHISTDIYGLPDGGQSAFFGFHIHEGRACSGNSADLFADTKMHYNPEKTDHPCHAGDLPPLLSANGRAKMTFITDRFKLSEVIGRAIVIHLMPDDFTTQPSGNSGVKIACGIITAERNSITF